MKKGFVTLLIFTLAVGLFAAETLKFSDRLPAANTKNIEPVGEEINPVLPTGSSLTSLREVTGVLVDSSKNGYGLLVPETDPISVYGDYIFMDYRCCPVR